MVETDKTCDSERGVRNLLEKVIFYVYVQ